MARKLDPTYLINPTLYSKHADLKTKLIMVSAVNTLQNCSSQCRRVGKMLVFAAILGCLDPVLTVAAAISSRSPFVSPLERREAADAAKRGFAREQSDHLAVLAAYQGWRDAHAEGRCACGTLIDHGQSSPTLLSERTFEPADLHARRAHACSSCSSSPSQVRRPSPTEQRQWKNRSFRQLSCGVNDRQPL